MKLNLKIKWHLVLFPILAFGFCGWFLVKYYQEKGLEIKILFSDAKSIDAEKTKVFYRGVPVGLVKGVNISEDGKRAEVIVSLEKNASQFAVEGSQFYLIYPKVGFEGVSGLETLISGSYITIEPGKKKNAKKTLFEGNLSKQQSKNPEEATSTYILETAHAESISIGDNIFFRGIVIGQVSLVRLNKTGQAVLVDIDIKNQHTRLIRENTVFWKKQGIKANLGLFGSDIRINSLDTILKGGIEIATPPEVKGMAKSYSKFPLLNDEPKNREKWNPELTFKKKVKNAR